jgi:hypothetical protein
METSADKMDCDFSIVKKAMIVEATMVVMAALTGKVSGCCWRCCSTETKNVRSAVVIILLWAMILELEDINAKADIHYLSPDIWLACFSTHEGAHQDCLASVFQIWNLA